MSPSGRLHCNTALQDYDEYDEEVQDDSIAKIGVQMQKEEGGR